MPTLTKPSSPSLKTNANLLADRINPLLRKAEPNPLAGVHYQGNTESDSAAEVSALLNAFKTFGRT